MGFFSKKKEESKKDGNKVMIGLNCPICKKNKFIVHVTYYLKVDDKWGKYDGHINALILNGDKSGVCMDCGIVAFGELIYKSNDTNKSAELYEKLMSVNSKLHFIFQKIIETVPSDKQVLEINNAFNAIYNNLKATDPLFFNTIKPDKYFNQSIKHATENREKYDVLK